MLGVLYLFCGELYYVDGVGVKFGFVVVEVVELYLVEVFIKVEFFNILSGVGKMLLLVCQGVGVVWVYVE